MPGTSTVPSAKRVSGRIAAAVGALVAAGWLGLRVPPTPFPPFPGGGEISERRPLPNGLPPPVRRYLQAAAGDQLPVIRSAVLTGRGTLRLQGLRLPTRFRFAHLAGSAYRHFFECTWFGLPLFRVNETYVDGVARMALPFSVVENLPNVNRAANLNLWGEAIWFPSLFATDPRVRWQPVDETHAQLIVPFEQSEDRFTIRFSDATGLVEWMETIRYKRPDDQTPTRWRFEPLAWDAFYGLRIPAQGAVRWMDERSPWLGLRLEHVVYNVDVSAYFRSTAP